jgi:hypothetical protein
VWEAGGPRSGPVNRRVGGWLTCFPPTQATRIGGTAAPPPPENPPVTARGRSQAECTRKTAARSWRDDSGGSYSGPLTGERQESMNADRSLGAILMTFRIRTCASRPSPQRLYTIAVATPRRSATCLTESSRSGAPRLSSGPGGGDCFSRHKSAANRGQRRRIHRRSGSQDYRRLATPCR